MTTNKSELLKKLEQNWDKEQKKESELTGEIIKELTEELKQTLSIQMQNVPNTIEKALKVKFWSGAILGVIATAIILSLGLTTYYTWKELEERANIRKDIAILKKTKESYEELIGLEKLGLIKISRGDNGEFYITSQSKKAKAYKNDSYTAIISITD